LLRSPIDRLHPVLVAALVVPLVLTVAGAASPQEPDVGRFVSLGDSYAAGPLIPPQTSLPVGCLRSDRNYPSVLAATLGAVEHVDVSCSGATTADLGSPQRTPLGTNAAQFDALTATTGLVTLTIGGNDVGFGEIVRECLTRSPLKPGGAACKERYTAGGDQLAERIAAAAPAVAAALETIGERAPDATVAVVGYPAILPDEGPGCFPVVPLTAGDVAYLRDTEKRLNAMLAAEARRAGTTFVDTYTPTIGHDVCTPPGTRWVEGLVPTAPAAPVHPNALGMTAMAAAVAEALAEEGVDPAV
jgi:lysophospholipase L1-like esterase